MMISVKSFFVPESITFLLYVSKIVLLKSQLGLNVFFNDNGFEVLAKSLHQVGLMDSVYIGKALLQLYMSNFKMCSIIIASLVV